LTSTPEIVTKVIPAFRIFTEESKPAVKLGFDGAGRALTLFTYDDFSLTGMRRISVVDFIAVNKCNQVSILLKCA